MTTQIEAAIAEVDAAIATPKSVVGVSYKVKYKERALGKNRATKSAMRSSDDWLARELKKHVLTSVKEGEKLIVSALEALLDANGVRHAHWNRTTPGWQGRLRMSGRLALNPIVAEAGFLILADGTEVKAPKTWISAHAK